MSKNNRPKIMFSVLIIALFFKSFLVQAQTAADLHGTWQFEKSSNEEQLTEQERTMLKAFFTGFTLTLKSDGTFEGLAFGKKDEGKWETNDFVDLIILYSKNMTQTIKYPIKLIDSNTIGLKFKTSSLILKKAS